jgi:small subunit ribosomal protein S1
MSTDPNSAITGQQPDSNAMAAASQASTEVIGVDESSPASSEANRFDESSLRKPVVIGSQRDTAQARPSQPKAVSDAINNPLDLSGQPKPEPPAAPIIRSMAGLNKDLETEISEALGDFSMDAIVAQTNVIAEEIESNTRVKGLVTEISNDRVFFKLNGQFEGVATHHHFKVDPKVGDLLEVIVRGRNKEDGLYELSVPGAAVGAADWENITEGSVVDARVTGSNTGGLEVAVNSLKGFIPASQIDRARVEDFAQYINQKFPCVVVEVNPEKRRLVLSRRAILDRENEEKRKQLVTELEPGQLREGLVTRLMDFGAFVDLGGVEGLIHVSKLAWTRVKHPKEVVKVGDKVRVKVEKIDNGANRISLSLRDTLEHPWTSVSDSFKVDDIVRGNVTRTTDFGAFVKLANGVEGLVHISELSYSRVARVTSVVKEGDSIEVKILSIDSETKKISLSHKACLAPPAPKESPAKAEEPEVVEPPRELAVKASSGSLKGGRDRKSGGEGIGLNW